MTIPVFVDYADSAPRQQRPLPDADLTLSGPTVLHDFFGRGAPGAAERPDGPEAFLVDFPAQSRTGAHFHSCDQFQVFFPASGAWYKNRPVDRIVVHYVDAYTTYGPFGTADEPMAYYTLRAKPSTITGFMPAARDRWVPGGKRRNLTVDVDPQDGAEVIAPQPDGLAASILVAAPYAEAELAPTPTISGGQYVLVLHGELVLDRRNLGPRTLGWRSPGDGESRVMAGANGCALLVLQFPGQAPTATG
jgi:hypothetical protein